jgi:hypothetical protein
MKYDDPKIRNLLLLLIRFWLGYRMTGASYSSVVGIIFHPRKGRSSKNGSDRSCISMPLTMALARAQNWPGAFCFPGTLYSGRQLC